MRWAILDKAYGYVGKGGGKFTPEVYSQETHDALLFNTFKEAWEAPNGCEHPVVVPVYVSISQGGLR